MVKASGHPYILVYTNGTANPITYYYVVNAQGDIIRVMQDHPDMTRDVLKQVPYLLEEPVAILSSKSSDSRLVFMGTLNDRSGNPVAAILELQPTSKGGQVMDFSIIASAYGKNRAGNLVKSSGVVYLDKKRTGEWLHGLGLQLPSDTTNLGSIGRITYPDGKVKIESVPFSQIASGVLPSEQIL